jgi:hypothetical protein
MNYSDQQAADAVVNVLGNSRWDAAGIASGFVALRGGATKEEAARRIFDRGSQTLRKSRELIEKMPHSGYLALLTPREEKGAAADPVPKLFPGRITEERFLELLDDLKGRRQGFDYRDSRGTEHGLDDFTLTEGRDALPVNVKVASTRFERSAQLVGLQPNDCVPIPAYKANAAVEKYPNLIYAISVDFEMLGILRSELPKLLSTEESLVWDLITRYAGSHTRDAEDLFVFEIVRKHWERLKFLIKPNPFHIISARKAIRVLQTKPERTPGIGMRGWGTGASAEVNVHVSLAADTTPWDNVGTRIEENGVKDIVGAVNRKRVEEIFDPEI